MNGDKSSLFWASSVLTFALDFLATSASPLALAGGSISSYLGYGLSGSLQPLFVLGLHGSLRAQKLALPSLAATVLNLT